MNIRVMIHEFSQTKIVIRINSNNSKNTIFVIHVNRIFKIRANRFTIHHSNRSPMQGIATVSRRLRRSNRTAHGRAWK